MEITMLKLRGWLKNNTQASPNTSAQEPSPAATPPQVAIPHTTQKDKYGNYGEVNSPYARKARRQLDATLRDKKERIPTSKNKNLVKMSEEKEFKTKIQPASPYKRSVFKPTLETIHERRETPQMVDGVTLPTLPTGQPKPSPGTRQDAPEVINGVVTTAVAPGTAAQ
jgi:hypothetical protein